MDILFQFVKLSPAYHYDTAHFVSPMPRTYRSAFVLLRPMQTTVWIMVAMSSLLMAVVLFLVAWQEKKLFDVELTTWSSPFHVAWYIYGTLLGETVSSEGDKKLASLLTLR